MMTTRNSRTASKRWLIWLPLLGFAFWLAAFGDRTTAPTQTTSNNTASALVSPIANPNQRDAALISTAKETHSAGKQPVQSLIPRASLIGGTNQHHNAIDLFAQRSWQPVSPTAEAARVSTEPELPPLPFIYIGKKIEDGQWEVYLVRTDEVFVVHEGDQLTASYRVEKLAPPSLSLRYLPMDQLQTLAIGDSD